MPDPRQVYADPSLHWGFITAKSDTQFEGQHFDRKEAGRPLSDGRIGERDLKGLRQEVTECISAFANANVEGGLLVIGVSRDGDVIGLDHLDESQKNALTAVHDLLTHATVMTKFHNCKNNCGQDDTIVLMYTSYSDHAICETLGSNPKSWWRQGPQNIRMNDEMREQLRREKGIVDFESSFCCSFDLADVDAGVIAEFRRGYLGDDARELTDVQLLYEIGAIMRDRSGGYAFTNAGALFFAANPQRFMPAAYVRLLRFSAAFEAQDRGLPTFEKAFSGPITKQIRDARTFLRESAFFKTYQRRNSDGGFVEEPEYPHLAVDEALVNAVAHRDYAINLPIECESYRDALAVHNPGRVLQRDRDVPESFSLDSMLLNSKPRNPRMIEWLKAMRDERGSAFVRALSEGTVRMRTEMTTIGLPAPFFRTSGQQTTVALRNNIDLREYSPITETEARFANLFPLARVGASVRSEPTDLAKSFMISLQNGLRSSGWFIDRDQYGQTVAHKRRQELPVPTDVSAILKMYPGYKFQLKDLSSHSYLCVDYSLLVKNVQTLSALLTKVDVSCLLGLSATVRVGERWTLGRLVACDAEWARVSLFETQSVESVRSSLVIPNLPIRILQELTAREGIVYDLHRAIKKHSLAGETGASRLRFEKIRLIVDELSETIFPMLVGESEYGLSGLPLVLKGEGTPPTSLSVARLPEPVVEFNRHREESDIREGITRHGAYDTSPRTIELVPLCLASQRGAMAQLIARLQFGKHKYRGSERTFSSRFVYDSIVTVDRYGDIIAECQRLVTERPEWVGDPSLRRLFLVVTPEDGAAIDDETSPYYTAKRFLLERGLPCQMVDLPTLADPDWKDLNLSLNIVAKCGGTPWVLPDAIPDADFFVGLSYTQGRRDTDRLMGYANVFNQYGRWEFYSGNTEPFFYAEREQQFGRLVEHTLQRLNLPESPHIYFHYSARFSRQDRLAILSAARKVRPQGTYSFVWVNATHNVRFADSRPETDGSLSRGSYVVASPSRIYLSTTGNNPYRKALGTPIPLELTVWSYGPLGHPDTPADLRALAVQVLNLTKLNWASTDSLCAEPITIKYAGDIAYLTAAFLRQGRAFILHRILEKTPWFI